MWNLLGTPIRVLGVSLVGCPEVPRKTSWLCNLLLTTVLIPSSLSAQERAMKVIVDFTEPGSIHWSIVNDGVMGGRSTSKMEYSEDGSALFTGFVSLENNGGFASTRAAFESLNLSGYAGVILRVRRKSGRNRARPGSRADACRRSRAVSAPCFPTSTPWTRPKFVKWVF